MKRAPGLRIAAPRPGWQLIELSIVLAVLAIISVVATRTIIALMAIESRSGQALQDAEVLERLGQQWRSDLHRATEVTVAENGTRIEIRQLDAATVTYRTSGRRLSREEADARRRTPSRETFAASARTWRFEESDNGRLVTMVRESAPLMLMGAGANVTPSKVDRIDAVRGTFAIGSMLVVEGALP